MPDEFGNLKGIAVPAAAWERVFGSKPPVIEASPPSVVFDETLAFERPDVRMVARSSQENQNRDKPPTAA